MPHAEITQPTNSQGQVSKLAGHLTRQRADWPCDLARRHLACHSRQRSAPVRARLRIWARVSIFTILVIFPSSRRLTNWALKRWLAAAIAKAGRLELSEGSNAAPASTRKTGVLCEANFWGEVVGVTGLEPAT